MFLFSPPQKPEFENIMEAKENVFDWWDDVLKYLREYCNRYWWDYFQQRWRDDFCDYKEECLCGKCHRENKHE